MGRNLKSNIIISTKVFHLIEKAKWRILVLHLAFSIKHLGLFHYYFCQNTYNLRKKIFCLINHY